MARVILDAFGGDNAPLEAIRGAAMAVEELGIPVILTGDREKILSIAKKQDISLEQIEIEHTPSVIPVCAEPSSIRREYADCSMAVGFRLLKEGRGDAFVSAGSSGALVVGGSVLAGRIRGIKRVAFAPVIPCFGGNGAYMLLDGGANIDCRPEMLLQFGVMGSAYMNKVMGFPNPRVGLINVGAEETKGGELQLAAYGLLKEAPIHFIGNVEPRDLPAGVCDVAVCDGFSGNIVLKLTEGVAKGFAGQLKNMFKQSLRTKLAYLAVQDGMDSLKKKMDYTEHGGACLLGSARPVIKAHGSSNAKAFKNAIRQAARFADNHVVEEIEQGLWELRAGAEKEAAGGEA